MDKKVNEGIQVKMKIEEVRKLNYFEYPLETLKLKSKINLKNVPFDLNLNLGINNPNEIFEFILTVHFYQKENENKIILFGIKTSHKFKIFDFEKVFKKDKNGKLLIDNGILSSLFGISISGTRGMLALLNTSDDYKDIVLPIVNPMDIILGINEVKK